MRIARIIVIENEPIIAMDIEETLSRAGLEVIGVAPSLTQAIDMHCERPADVMLMDSDSTNGDTALPWFVPPVVLIASRDKQNSGGALRLTDDCVCAVVVKPFLSMHLVDAVACVLQGRSYASAHGDGKKTLQRGDNRRCGSQN